MKKLESIAEKISLKPLEELSKNELMTILEIRNKKSIRDCMYTNHEISVEEHLKWAEETKNSLQAKFLAAIFCENIVGAISIKDIDDERRQCYWGFYIDNKFHGLGIGAALELKFLDLAFDDMHMEKVNCEVLENNTRAILIYKKFGFQEEGHRCIIRNGDNLEAILLGITKDEWIAQRKILLTKHS